MKARKTFDVKNLIAIVNERNKNSICSPDVRQGWNDLLDSILHATGNYNGFGYLQETSVPKGQKPGMAKDEKGENIFPDPTRIYYYGSF